MSDWQMQTPVAFIIFNRPTVTERVFAAIAEARPPKLLVIADGPREDHPGEARACDATRAVVERVDWECQVSTQYAASNLGCRRRVSSGLDWVFDTVAEAIVLEDDCLPDPSFFRFCEELLHRYRDDGRVAQIGGANFQFGHRRTADSYCFSLYPHIWGWASWRRAWQHYDVGLSRWPQLRGSDWLQNVVGDPKQMRYWRRIFDKVDAGDVDSWAYQWAFVCWSRGALTALPDVNLISNIGFGQDSTHTRSRSALANMPRGAMQFPLRHPATVTRNGAADAFTASRVYPTLLPRLLDKARRDPRALMRQARERGASALSRRQAPGRKTDG